MRVLSLIAELGLEENEEIELKEIKMQKSLKMKLKAAEDNVFRRR